MKQKRNKVKFCWRLYLTKTTAMYVIPCFSRQSIRGSLLRISSGLFTRGTPTPAPRSPRGLRGPLRGHKTRGANPSSPFLLPRVILFSYTRITHLASSSVQPAIKATRSITTNTNMDSDFCTKNPKSRNVSYSARESLFSRISILNELMIAP